MEQEQAEILALKALSYLVGLDEEMDRFSALTGIGSADIMERANDPELLAGVVDFFLAHEDLLTEFCAVHDYDPETPLRARQALPGGDLPHWT